MSDTVSRKALIEWLSDKEQFDSPHVYRLINALKEGVFPSTESEGEAARLRQALEELMGIIVIMQDASESSSLRYNAGNMALHKIKEALSNTAEPAAQREEFALSLNRKQLSNLVSRHGGNPTLKEMLCNEADNGGKANE